jgi:hypothetical protein
MIGSPGSIIKKACSTLGMPERAEDAQKSLSIVVAACWPPRPRVKMAGLMPWCILI